MRLTSRNASYSVSPNICRMNGLRTRPSPCSPESAPPNSSTRSATSLRDGFELANAFLGLQVDHRPHVQAADRSVRVDPGRGSVASRSISRKRPMNSLSFSGATAVSSTKEIDLASSFIAMESPSAASRRLQMWACAGGIGFGVVVIAQLARAQIVFERLQPRRQILLAVGVEFDAQSGGRIAFDERRCECGRARRSGACNRGWICPSPRPPRACVAGSRAWRPAIPADRANDDHHHRFGLGQRHQRSLASSTMPSVPSEPTMIFARFTGFAGSVNSSRL